MESIVFALPFVFAVFTGYFDAARTLKSDAPGESIYWRYPKELYPVFYNDVKDGNYRAAVMDGMTMYTEFDLWYRGGNEYYPSFKQFGSMFPPYKGADYWHQMKNYQTWCLSLIAVSSAASVYMAGDFKWYHFTFLTMHGIEGISFEFFYKYVLRKKKHREDGNLWKYTKRQFKKINIF